MARSFNVIVFLMALFASSTHAFTQLPNAVGKAGSASVSSLNPTSFSVTDMNSCPSESTTALMERRWNFNEARGPWGLKKNAEIWNGRVAQMGFTIVLLQELITGKGVIAGLNDGDFLSYALLGFTGFSVVGLSAFLAFKGKENDIVY